MYGDFQDQRKDHKEKRNWCNYLSELEETLQDFQFLPKYIRSTDFNALKTQGTWLELFNQRRGKVVRY